jgi:hypothetical protein
MASTPTLDDIAHVWGQDLQLSPSGDLARANGAQRTQQRLLRRLMTARAGAEYIWEPAYGAGLPQDIGANVDLAKVRAIVRGQLALEASVATAPAPQINVREIANGLSVAVTYWTLPDKQPVSLSFDLTE